MPVFLPKNGWEINHFQPDFLTLLPNMTISSGSKTLTFLKIVPKRNITRSVTLEKGGKKSSSKSSDSGKNEEKEEPKESENKEEFKEESVIAAKTQSGSKEEKEKTLDTFEATPTSSENSTAALDPQDESQFSKN